MKKRKQREGMRKERKSALLAFGSGKNREVEKRGTPRTPAFSRCVKAKSRRAKTCNGSPLRQRVPSLAKVHTGKMVGDVCGCVYSHAPCACTCKQVYTLDPSSIVRQMLFTKLGSSVELN